MASKVEPGATQDNAEIVCVEEKGTQENEEIACENKGTQEDKEIVCVEDKGTQEKEIVCVEDKSTQEKEIGCVEDKNTQKEIVSKEDKATDEAEIVSGEDKGTDEAEIVSGEDKATDEEEIVRGEDKATDEEEIVSGEDKGTDEEIVSGEDKATDEEIVSGEDKATDEEIVSGEDKATDEEEIVSGEDKATDEEEIVSEEDTSTDEDDTLLYLRYVNIREDAEIVFVEDKGGAKMKLQLIDGIYYPTFPYEVIKRLPSLTIRDDDVILAGYLKAGTHWVWEMLRMLLAGTTDVPNAEKDEGMIEQTPSDILDAMPSPRVLNTHVYFEKLPAEVFKKTPKMLYLTRNPKDTAVSLYHHHKKLYDYYSYDGTFENYLHLFVEGKVDYGSWFDHIRNWSEACERPDLQILEVNYEELSRNTLDQVIRIIYFLHLRPTAELVSEVIAECSLDRMRDKKGKFDLDAEGNSIMYRKGQVGDWKNYFDDETNAWFDSVYEEKMKDIETLFEWTFEP